MYHGIPRREWSSTALIVVKAEGWTSQASLFRCFPRQLSTTFSMTLLGAINSHIQAKRVCPARESNPRHSRYECRLRILYTICIYINLILSILNFLCYLSTYVMFNMSLVTSTIQAHVTPNFLKHLLKLSLSQNIKKPLNPEFRIKASLAKSQHPKTSTIRDMAFPTHYTPIVLLSTF